MNPLSLALEGGSVLSSLFGLFGGDDQKHADQYVDQAVQQLIKVHVPDPAQQEIELQRYRSAGQLSPELEHSIKADPSAFEQITQNQKYAQAQNHALSQLQSLGEEGGLNLTDKADLQDELSASANKDKANRSAITDEMARRGQLGSGMALQAQLAGAQSAGDRDASSRLRIMGGAQDRALKSIMGAGDLGGKLQAQDYGMKSDAATARDRINTFNTTNAQNVQQRNVAANNAAQGFNLENNQKLMNSNADMANKEQTYNKELQQQQFDNNMKQAGAVANAYTGAANQANKDDDKRRQSWGAVGSGLGQIGSSIQNQNNWDDWMKKAKGVK